MQQDGIEGKKRQFRLIIRLTAAMLACLFGSLWLAMYFARILAPPEPTIAANLRDVTLAAFIGSLIWCVWLYVNYRKSGSE